ncbi:helix-turn-helix domain-containing protein [Acidipropionibacterium timonense]|uniref:helix-turn-helix domain-containing protein n=1 Tax=Acidipropionibacterium timonense TaxID=2161818 RepID=UPI0010327797|nr:helix-turn-helix domain-containing protein [Acidipropionibacterium timonense]
MTWIDPDRWYKPAEAAPLIGKSKRTVQDWCRGRIICAREDKGPRGGVRYLIPGGVLAAYVRDNTPRRAR